MKKIFQKNASKFLSGLGIITCISLVSCGEEIGKDNGESDNEFGEENDESSHGKQSAASNDESGEKSDPNGDKELFDMTIKIVKSKIGDDEKFKQLEAIYGEGLSELYSMMNGENDDLFDKFKNDSKRILKLDDEGFNALMSEAVSEAEKQLKANRQSVDDESPDGADEETTSGN